MNSRAWFDRKLLVSMLLGFSSGLPLALIGATLQAWLTDEKMDIKSIGLYSLFAIPASLKFLWAPFFDRYFPPFLGRRRGWLIIIQSLLALSLMYMAALSPTLNPVGFGLITFCVALFSASQDILTDAYRTDLFHSQDTASKGLSVYVLGYRVAMLFSGALALWLADMISWSTVYALMAGAMVVGIMGTLLGQESKVVTRPKTLLEAFYLPLKDFFSRHAAGQILLFLILYKLDTFVSTAFRTTFLMNVGFSKSEIGAVGKTVGLTAGILGSLIGGYLVPKFSLKRSLIIFGFLQAVSNLLFSMLTHFGKNHFALIVTLASDELIGSIGTIAYATLITLLCSAQFTSAQFALFSSLMAIPRALSGPPSGWLAAKLGVGPDLPWEALMSAWNKYFIISCFFAIPALLLLLNFDQWIRPSDNRPDPRD